MNEFEHIALRLKQSTGAGSDRELAALLGMGEKTFGSRKMRGKFPTELVYVLAAKRPDLNIDVDYVLTGQTRAFLERIDALKQATDTAMSLQLPLDEQVFVRDLLFAIHQKDSEFVHLLIESHVQRRSGGTKQ